MHPTGEFSPSERARLLRINDDLQEEADAFLAESGLGGILSSHGFAKVGSYAMGTMTWRDLDFEHVVETPSWSDHWALGHELAETGWGWRLTCIDQYRNPTEPSESGLYWGVRACSPAGGPIWKLDLWTARKEEFLIEVRERWAGAMNEDSRVHILSIKEAVCQDPRYRRALLSVHIYEAVLDDGVRGIDAFWEWWGRRYGG